MRWNDDEHYGKYWDVEMAYVHNNNNNSNIKYRVEWN